MAMGIQGNLIRPGPGVNTRNQAGLLVVVLSAVAKANLLDYPFPIPARLIVPDPGIDVSIENVYHQGRHNVKEPGGQHRSLDDGEVPLVDALEH